MSTSKEFQLSYACCRGRLNEVKGLIDEGVDVDWDENEWTPLIIAVIWGYVDIIRLLVDNGANINSKGNDGNTALHLAAKIGDKESMLTLLKRGARVTMKNRM